MTLKTPEQIAEQIAASPAFADLTVDDLGLSVETMMIVAIEADRAQLLNSLRDRPEVVPIEETVRRHAFIKGYETAIQDVRSRL